VYPNCQNFTAFGYGKRSCPGADFGERTVVIMLAKLGWAINVRPPLSPETNELWGKKSNFNYRIEARDEQRVEVVQRESDEISL
jgi:hypothetical protein